MESLDYIPISSSSSVKKKRKMLRNGGEGGQSGGSSPASKRLLQQPVIRRLPSEPKPRSSGMSRVEWSKLKSRVLDYLETNIDRSYIDIEEMARNLRGKFPEYSRRKFREFHRQVNDCFEQIEKSENINEMADNSVKSQPTIVDLIDEESDTKSGPASPMIMDISAPLSPTKPTPSTITKKSSKRKELQFSVPKCNFSYIGGCDDIIEKVYDASRHLILPQNYARLNKRPPKGFLLHGPPGCGKTLMANSVAGTLKIPLISISGTELISGISGDSESKIRRIFEQAKEMASPCILLLDRIDVIAKRRENAQKDMELRIVSQLLTSLNDLDSGESQIFVIGVTDRLEAIDPALITALGRDIAMGIPDAKARKMILEVMCSDLTIDSSIDYKELAMLTPGYVGSDLQALITAAAGFAEKRHYNSTKEMYKTATGDSDIDLEKLLNWIDTNNEVDEKLNQLFITLDDFQRALKTIQPLAMKEGFATVPDVSFDDIGALDHIRKSLEMAICVPVKHPEVVEEMGLDVPSGVLLCGPPGCGKTLLAKAVANQAGINFISVKGPELINMYVGESERAVRQVFQRARNSVPCVIFFDEIDSICPRRSGSDSGSGSNRVVNQLLTEMDGVEGRKGVYVMGASNRVDVIDEAILRPGRLTKILFVDLPNPEGRVDILRKLTKNGTKPKLSSEVDLNEIAKSPQCEGFSGADLGNLVYQAAEIRVQDLLSSSLAMDSNSSWSGMALNMEHFQRAFENVQASVTGKQKRKYELMKSQYSGGIKTPAPSVQDTPENESSING